MDNEGGFHPATEPEPAHGGFIWRAILRPADPGGTYNITASDGTRNGTTSLLRVTYGDVFFCRLAAFQCRLRPHSLHSVLTASIHSFALIVTIKSSANDISARTCLILCT